VQSNTLFGCYVAHLSSLWPALGEFEQTFIGVWEYSYPLGASISFPSLSTPLSLNLDEVGS